MHFVKPCGCRIPFQDDAPYPIESKCRCKGQANRTTSGDQDGGLWEYFDAKTVGCLAMAIHLVKVRSLDESLLAKLMTDRTCEDGMMDIMNTMIWGLEKERCKADSTVQWARSCLGNSVSDTRKRPKGTHKNYSGQVKQLAEAAISGVLPRHSR